MLERGATVYRLTDFMPTCVSVYRYARMPFVRPMERQWVPAIRRLMAAKGWNQRALSEASGVRPNTLSDLLGGTDSKIDTLAALAKALDAPLWALFCTDHEHALFSERARQDDAAQTAAAQQQATADRILEGLKPMIMAAVKGEIEPVASTPVLTKRPRKVGR